jgi:hypothetical protein
MVLVRQSPKADARELRSIVPRRFIATLAAMSALLMVAPAASLEIKPLGCRGAYSKEVNTDKLTLLPRGVGLAECGRTEKQVDCTRTGEYIKGDMANQPVHEAITRQAYQQVFGRRISTPNFESPLVSGVVWNDDPQWMLRKLIYNKGLQLLNRYASTMGRWEREPNADDLTIRSHFGDLQFLHAMRPAGLSEHEALQRMRAWVSAAHRVAIGEVSSKVRLSDAGFDLAVPRLNCPPKRDGNCSVRSLLDREGRFWRHVDERVGELNMRWLAAGTILHVLQDSNSRSHTQIKVPPEAGAVPRRAVSSYDAENRKDHCWERHGKR